MSIHRQIILLEQSISSHNCPAATQQTLTEIRELLKIIAHCFDGPTGAHTLEEEITEVTPQELRKALVCLLSKAEEQGNAAQLDEQWRQEILNYVDGV